MILLCFLLNVNKRFLNVSGMFDVIGKLIGLNISLYRLVEFFWEYFRILDIR